MTTVYEAGFSEQCADGLGKLDALRLREREKAARKADLIRANMRRASKPGPDRLRSGDAPGSRKRQDGALNP
jgi:hypothetical protein